LLIAYYLNLLFYFCFEFYVFLNLVTLSLRLCAVLEASTKVHRRGQNLHPSSPKPLN